MGFEQEQVLEDEYVMRTFARKPVEIVSGSGMRVYDDRGGEYLDFLGGIGACSLGHCHPAVVEALSEQAGRLIHVGNYYYIEKRGELARTFSRLLNETEDRGRSTTWKTFFANSGAEANECAVKLARLWSKKKGDGSQTIVTLDGSFHGRTLATLAATAQPAKQEAFQPLPGGFTHTAANDIPALEALMAARGDEVCAIMVECIQGESGVHPCTPGFLQAAERLAHEHGALLIADEVQCGMFRCGDHPFAFQHFGITPDIVAIAKGVADGFPCGMCSAKADVAEAFSPGDHGTTFGGSNLAVAAATATLNAIVDEGIAASVTEVGAYLRESLARLDGVVEVRGLGLMVACDLSDGIDASTVVSSGLDSGLLLNCTGPRTLRFLPPLICRFDDVDQMVARLGKLLAAAIS